MPAAVSESSRPLHGEQIRGLKIDQLAGRRELSHSGHAMEFNIRDRVRTTIGEDLPGVGVVELFDASGPDYTTLSLEEAIAKSRSRPGNKYNPMRFLVSIATSGLAVVTSRMGYDVPGNVGIPAPSRYSQFAGEERTIHLRDYATSTDNGLLLQRHTERLARRDIDPSIAIAQTAIDDTFRYMISGCQERN